MSEMRKFLVFVGEKEAKTAVGDELKKWVSDMLTI